MKTVPYKKYKHSSIEWLGDVPAHWKTPSVKRHYIIQLGKMLQSRSNHSKDTEVHYLKAQHVQWFSVRTADAPKMWASVGDINQFGVIQGDLLVCEGGEGGRCGLIKEIDSDYIIQNALHRVRPLGNCRNDYLQYVMSFVSSIGWFDAINNKATIAHFPKEKFGSLCIPFPPLPEQTAIVRYLDYVNGRIQRYVRAKQKLIGLLEEQKQAIIHHTVTRGLNPDAPLKPSGVKWLGDVPAHWEIQRLKIGTDNIVELKNHRDVGELYLALENVESWTGKIHGTDPETKFDSQVKQFKAGDILFGKLRPYLAKVTRPVQDGICVGEFLVLRPRCIEQDAGYLELFLRSKSVIDAINTSTFGAKMPRTDWAFIGNIEQLLPPLPEQTAIVKHLDHATANLNAAITRARREIELLTEYRTRLTADVVTGKLDVRKAAAQLPNDSQQDDPKTAT